MEMNTLKKVIYNCRQATFLIEKKQLAQLTLREKVELRIHLAGCSVCKIFQQQSILINKLVSTHFQRSSAKELKLDNEFKKTLQELIDRETNKN